MRKIRKQGKIRKQDILDLFVRPAPVDAGDNDTVFVRFEPREWTFVAGMLSGMGILYLGMYFLSARLWLFSALAFAAGIFVWVQAARCEFGRVSVPLRRAWEKGRGPRGAEFALSSPSLDRNGWNLADLTDEARETYGNVFDMLISSQPFLPFDRISFTAKPVTHAEAESGAFLLNPEIYVVESNTDLWLVQDDGTFRLCSQKATLMQVKALPSHAMFVFAENSDDLPDMQVLPRFPDGVRITRVLERDAYLRCGNFFRIPDLYGSGYAEMREDRAPEAEEAASVEGNGPAKDVAAPSGLRDMAERLLSFARPLPPDFRNTVIPDEDIRALVEQAALDILTVARDAEDHPEKRASLGLMESYYLPEAVKYAGVCLMPKAEAEKTENGKARYEAASLALRDFARAAAGMRNALETEKTDDLSSDTYAFRRMLSMNGYLDGTKKEKDPARADA